MKKGSRGLLIQVASRPHLVPPTEISAPCKTFLARAPPRCRKFLSSMARNSNLLMQCRNQKWLRTKSEIWRIQMFRRVKLLRSRRGEGGPKSSLNPMCSIRPTSGTTTRLGCSTEIRKLTSLCRLLDRAILLKWRMIIGGLLGAEIRLPRSRLSLRIWTSLIADRFLTILRTSLQATMAMSLPKIRNPFLTDPTTTVRFLRSITPGEP